MKLMKSLALGALALLLCSSGAAFADSSCAKGKNSSKAYLEAVNFPQENVFLTPFSAIPLGATTLASSDLELGSDGLL
jgi:hypothetical protein